MLGAPPAFVLSQDQTLCKMIFNHFKSVKSRSLSTQSLASCELLFGIFKCSLHFKRFRYKYSILFNFQGPAFTSRLTGDLFILPHRPGLVKHFFRSVFKFWGSAGRSVERSHIVLPFPPFVNPFFQKSPDFFQTAFRLRYPARRNRGPPSLYRTALL